MIEPRQSLFKPSFSKIALHLMIIFLTSPGLYDSKALAQSPLISFDKIFDQFNGVAVWGSFSPSNWHQQDFSTRKFLGFDGAPFRYGFEFLVGPYPAKQTNPITDSLEKLLNRWEVTRYNDLSTMETLNHLAPTIDSLRRINERFEKYFRNPHPTPADLEPLAEQADSINNMMYIINDLKSRSRKGEGEKWKVEGGLGVDFSDSYRNISNSFNIRIPVRGYYVSAYLETPPIAGDNLSCYFGGTGGFYTINNGTLYQPDSTRHFGISDNALGLEIVGGFAQQIGSAEVLLEISYQYLAFDGLQYTNGTNLVLPSNAAPSRIDLSGFYITVGFQGAKKSGE